MKDLIKNEYNSLLALTMFFSILLVLIDYIWMLQNAAPPRWDQSLYLLISEHYYKALTDKGVFELFRVISNTAGSRAPLISILPLPFYLLLGNNQISAMFVNFSFLLLLSYFLFKLVAKLYNPRAAFISVLAAQSMPLFYTLSRNFFVEYGIAAMTVIYFYFLIKSDSFEDRKCNVMLGILIGLGVLLKTTFLMYIGLPSLWILYLKQKHKRDLFTFYFLRQMAIMICVAIIIASIWYNPRNLISSISFGFSNAYGAIGDHYNAPISMYIRRIIFFGITKYYSLMAVILLSSYLMISLVNKKRIVISGNDKENAVFLLLWFFPLVLCAFSKDKDPRFVLPMLVAPSIVIGLLIEFFAARLLKKYNLVKYLLIVVMLFFVPVRSMFLATFYEHDTAPDKRDWRFNEIVNYMYKEVYSGRTNGSKFVIYLQDHQAINENTLNYYVSLNDFKDPIQITRWKWGAKDIAVALDNIQKLKPSFLIWAEGLSKNEEPPFLNEFDDDLHKMLLDGKLPYVFDKAFHLKYGVTIMLYKRTPEIIGPKMITQEVKR